MQLQNTVLPHNKTDDFFPNRNTILEIETFIMDEILKTLKIMSQLTTFLRQERKWWLMPLIFILIVFIVLLFITQPLQVVAPFVYSIL